jgi:hypothetical protein
VNRRSVDLEGDSSRRAGQGEMSTGTGDVINVEVVQKSSMQAVLSAYSLSHDQVCLDSETCVSTSSYLMRRRNASNHTSPSLSHRNQYIPPTQRHPPDPPTYPPTH